MSINTILLKFATLLSEQIVESGKQDCGARWTELMIMHGRQLYNYGYKRGLEDARKKQKHAKPQPARQL